ncbi:SRPBCC family protein [Mesorhizobium sp. B1-1-8]|uniref:SRPBCC family protein n=1 Tax=Mesorhizobium sp. B1-1-8 TaxID=2589976 RepID=UPI0015E274BD|nr:SRPBCC domain-containing protein [Mesorhizobium sp. B1-1-8]UCI07197.1 SRPBCC domain-containing protein [Mesorhizobium sp. B1-1-8]
MTVTEDTTLVITRNFEAPSTRVFDAWLTREEWQSWIGPDGVDCEISKLEPHVGGQYRLEMHMGGQAPIAVAGVFKIIDRPRTLSFTWGAEGDLSRQSLVTLTFTELEGKTEMTLRQEGLGSAANHDQHEQGWNSTLNKLARHLKREQR